MCFRSFLITFLTALIIISAGSGEASAEEQAAAGPDQPVASDPADVPAEFATPTADKKADPDTLEKADNFFRPLKIGEDVFTLGGYLQPAYKHVMDTSFNNEDTDGFIIRNARLTAKAAYEFNSWFAMQARFNFDVSQGAFLVKDIAGSLIFLKRAIMLDVGQFKVPYSLLELTPESDMQFAMNAQISRLALGRDRGIQLAGEIDAGANVWLAYQFGIFNGEGSNALENTDSKFMYTGRFEIAPLGPLSLSEADLENSDIRLGLSGGFVYIPSVARQDLGKGDLEAEEWRYNGALRLKFKGLSLRGEYLGASVNLKDPEAGVVTDDSNKDYKRYAFYAQAGYVLPFPWFKTPKFELVFRYDQSDINDEQDGYTVDAQGERQYILWDYSELRHIDVGANMYVFDNRLKLSFLYRLTDLLEGPKTNSSGGVLLGDAIFVMMQLGWF